MFSSREPAGLAVPTYPAIVTASPGSSHAWVWRLDARSLHQAPPGAREFNFVTRAGRVAGTLLQHPYADDRHGGVRSLDGPGHEISANRATSARLSRARRSSTPSPHWKEVGEDDLTRLACPDFELRHSPSPAANAPSGSPIRSGAHRHSRRPGPSSWPVPGMHGAEKEVGPICAPLCPRRAPWSALGGWLYGAGDGNRTHDIQLGKPFRLSSKIKPLADFRSNLSRLEFRRRSVCFVLYHPDAGQVVQINTGADGGTRPSR